MKKRNGFYNGRSRGLHHRRQKHFIVRQLESELGCKAFLENHQFIENPNCNMCGEQATLKLYRSKLHWCCYEGHVYKQNEEEKKWQCSFRKSIYADTWLYRSRLTVKQVVIFVKLYMENTFSSDQARQKRNETTFFGKWLGNIKVI